MKRRNKVIGLMWILTLLLTSSVIYVFAQAPTVTTWLQPGSLTDTASYVIWDDGGNYFSKNGETGQVTSSTNASAIIQNSLDALTAGRTSKEKVVIRFDDVEITHLIEIPNYTIVEIQGKLKLGAAASYIFYSQNVVRVEVFGGEFTGVQRNATNVNTAIKFDGCAEIYVHDTIISGFYGLLGGFGIDFISCQRSEISNVQVRDCGADGIALNGCEDIIVSDLYLIDNGFVDLGGVGLWVNSDNVVVNNIVAINNSYAGVRIEAWDTSRGNVDVSNIVTIGNLNGVVLNEYTGGMAYSLFGVTVSNVVGHSNLQNGINIYSDDAGGVTEVILSNIRLDDNGDASHGYGINIDNVTGVFLNDVIVKESYYSGIRLVRVPYAKITNALLYNNGDSGLFGPSGLTLYDATYGYFAGITSIDNQGVKTQEWGIDELNNSNFNIFSGCDTNDNLTGGMSIVGANSTINNSWNSTVWIENWP